MDKYQKINRALASKLGWVYTEDPDPELCTKEWQSPDGEWHSEPAWSLRNAKAFSLMVQYECYPLVSVNSEEISINVGLPNVESVREKISDHVDKEAATRYALVRAVIEKVTFAGNISA